MSRDGGTLVVSRNWWISFFAFFCTSDRAFYFPTGLCSPDPTNCGQMGTAGLSFFCFWVLGTVSWNFWFFCSVLLYRRTCVPARFLFFLSLRLTELRKRGSVVGATVAYKSLRCTSASALLLIHQSIDHLHQTTGLMSWLRPGESKMPAFMPWPQSGRIYAV
jgi:hypothetical protein